MNARCANPLEEVPNEQYLLRHIILPQIARYRKSLQASGAMTHTGPCRPDNQPRTLQIHPDDLEQRLREQQERKGSEQPSGGYTAHDREAQHIVSETYRVLDSHAQEIINARNERAKNGHPLAYDAALHGQADAPTPGALDDIRWMWAGLCAYLSSINPLKRFCKK